MARKFKVTQRAFNAVKKVAKTGASKTYIMKVSGLSNMTVYRILKAKNYEEYRGNTAKISKRDYEKRKNLERMRLSEADECRLAINEMAAKLFSVESKLIELCGRVQVLELTQAKSKKHWWSK